MPLLLKNTLAFSSLLGVLGDLLVSAKLPCWTVLKILASLRPSFFALNRIAFAFTFSAHRSLTTAVLLHKLHSGGHTGTIRCNQRHQPSHHAAICIDSAPCSLVPARHFGGSIAVFAITALSQKPPANSNRFPSHVRPQSDPTSSHPRRYKSRLLDKSRCSALPRTCSNSSQFPA